MKTTKKITIIIIIFIAFNIIAFLNYNNSLLDYKDHVSQLNTYYLENLNFTEIPLGAHYWKNENIIRVGSDSIELSSNLGETWDYKEDLPDNFIHPARTLKENLLADTSNVYFKIDEKWDRMINNYRIWHRSLFDTENHIIIGSYGDVIYIIDKENLEDLVYFEKPLNTTHFHFTAFDPYTKDIYASLGDAHKHKITGIKRSQDLGKSWQWFHKVKSSFQEKHRQPTAVAFTKNNIIFGTDSPPHGFFSYNRENKEFKQDFVMDDIYKSWITDIAIIDDNFWATSRSFSQKPEFGILWFSFDGKNWQAIYIFNKTPYWIESKDDNQYISIGFLDDKNDKGYIIETIDNEKMKEIIKNAPKLEDDTSLFQRYLLKISRSYIDFSKSLFRLVIRTGI